MFKSSLTKRAAGIAAGITVLGLVTAHGAQAASSTATATQTITANINSAASLTLGSPTITFTSTSSTGTTPATEGGNSFSVSAQARTGSSSTVTLTVLAGGDLTSGGNTIAINNVTWTATGTGYANGTLNKTTAQSVGSWTGSGLYNGTMSFFLANSNSYAVGTYTATITYTLTAP